MCWPHVRIPPCEQPRMLTFTALLLLLKVLLVTTLTVPPPLSTVTLNIKDDNFQKLCDLKLAKAMPYLKPWKEVPLQAQGCTVPYYGPQGHGQFPQEVHIVHIMEVGKLMQTLPSGPQTLVPIILQLDSASCRNKTISFPTQVPSEHYNEMFKNDSNLPQDYKDESRVKRKNIPMILKLQDMAFNSKSVASGVKQSSSVVSANPIMFTQRRPLILLLTSDQPVTWQIRPGICWLKDQWTNVQAVVERDSSVDSDIAVEVTPKAWAKKINRKNIQRFARRTYHGVASFTQIRAANHIRISVGPRGSSDSGKSLPLTLRNQNKLNFCDFSSRENSAVVQASLSIPLSAEYCILGGEKAMNVFIIEIEPAKSSVSETLKDENMLSVNNHGNVSRKAFSPVSVYLSENKFSIIGSSGKDSIVEQSNFTIILRSLQHTHWILSSSVQHSGVHVVLDQGDTIYYMDNLGRVLNTSFLPLPESRSELLQKVLPELDTSINYFKINQATGFSLTIDNHKHQTADQQRSELHPYLSTSILRLPPGTFVQPAVDLIDAGNEKDILRILESEMVLGCGKTVFEIVLPAPVLMHLGVKSLHLKDRSCKSQSNGTHFILTSPLKSCGSDTHTSGRASVISNSVYVNVLSSSRSGMTSAVPSNPELTQTGVPIACGLKTALHDDVVRSIFVSRGDITSEEKDGGLASSSQSSASSSIYQLELYHKDAVSGALSLIKNRDIIDLESRVYVQAWMDDAPSAQAVIESCWISSLPHSAVWLPNQKKVLLRGMCPVEISVQLEKQVSRDKAFVFSFQVMEEFSHMGQELYIHCQVGVCLSKFKHMKGKPILCVDPQNYCLHLNPLSTSGALLSTAHQLLTRGPLLVPSVGHTFTPDSPPETKCTNVSIFPYSSAISMNITILIALCSFVIGIGLTATLWYIHNKTEPTRRSYHGREHSQGSQTAVLGSSLSPHSACSSTNSQSIITS